MRKVTYSCDLCKRAIDDGWETGIELPKNTEGCIQLVGAFYASIHLCRSCMIVIQQATKVCVAGYDDCSRGFSCSAADHGGV